MTLYKNKYRVESTRLKNWDYASNGWYFVTICTKEKFCYFGEIQDSQMQLSTIGKIAQQFWLDIPKHFQQIKIDASVVMPNHVHGIIVIDKSALENRQPTVETRNFASLRNTTTPTDQSNKFAPLKPKSLSSIIQSYKSAVTRWCRQNGYDSFAWQPRFYDHIIRDDESLDRIREYIINNPSKWDEDKHNPANFYF